MKELLEQFPKEGWIKLVRSDTNNNKWWCCYDETTEAAINRRILNKPLEILNESWGDTPEEAMQKVLERLKLNGIIN